MKEQLKKSFKSFGRLVLSLFTFGTNSNDVDNEDVIKEDAQDLMDNQGRNIGDIDPKNENDALKEEAITSPGKMAVKNYFRNPLGVIGLILLVGILLVVFVGSAVIPFNPYQSEGTLINVPAGSGYMNYASEMEKEGVEKISVGNTFGVGLTKEKNYYYWGKNNEDDVTKIPKEIKEKLDGKKIKDVAAGDKHILVATEDNELYGWGNDSFQQTKIPPMKESQIKQEGIKKIGAGVQYSVVLTEKNNIVVWGSTMNSRLDLIPSEVQGKIVDFDTNGTNILALLKDGSLQLLGVRGAEIDVGAPDEIKNNKVKIEKIALTTNSAAAIAENGKLYVWGPARANLSGKNIPKIEGKIKDIVGGTNHFTVLDDKGEIYSWGNNVYGEADAPKGKYEKVFSGYFNNYAVNKDSKIDTWGLKGFRFGSDDQGRDIFTRLIHGGKMTMIISFVSVVIQVVLGVLIGMISGYAGGKVDNVLMRITEIVQSFPFYPLIITLSALLPVNTSQNTRLMMIMVLLGVIGWTGIARLVRGQILAERERDYIIAAKALGVTNSSILAKHILPNILSIIIVNATLGFAGNLLTEAGLSFLGFGVQEPMPSWGNMMTNAQSSDVINIYWWRWVVPALAVFLAAFSVNLIGDALRDAIDPRSNER